MFVFLNGEYFPEEKAVVSVFDRSFQFGDGLFETLRVYRGKPFRWTDHWERLKRGAEFLKIAVPFTEEELYMHAVGMIAGNQMPEALLRIALSRGVGMRGYSPRGANRPTLVMTLHPAPETKGSPGWRVITASPRLSAGEPLAQFKTCNKLPQILARAEADAAGADEALLLNTAGEVVEGGGSNLFWIEDGVVCTPPLVSGILAGVTRVVVLELCAKLGLRSREASITRERLAEVEGVFMSLSSRGVMEVLALDGRELKRSREIVGKLREAYEMLVLGA